MDSDNVYIQDVPEGITVTSNDEFEKLMRGEARVELGWDGAIQKGGPQGRERYILIDPDKVPRYASEWHYLAYNHQELALRGDLQGMKIQCPGRQPLVTRHLLTLGTSNKAFDSNLHGPQCEGFRPIPKEPATMELVTGNETDEYIEVGILDGGNIHLNMATKSGPRKRSVATFETSIERNASTMRVFVLKTDRLVSRTKPIEFFVGCRPIEDHLKSQDRLVPMKIDGSSVFFYPEVWKAAERDFEETDHEVEETDQEDEETDQTDQEDLKAAPERIRIKTLEDACKALAAGQSHYDDAVFEQFDVVPIFDTKEEKLRTPHPLSVTHAEHLATLLAMLYNAYEITHDEKWWSVMVHTIEAAGRVAMPTPSTLAEAITAFMNFERPFTLEDAEALQREDLVLDKTLLCAVHEVLRQSAVPDFDKGKLGDYAPHRQLLGFLNACQEMIPIELYEKHVNLGHIRKQVAQHLRFYDKLTNTPPHSVPVVTISGDISKDKSEAKDEKIYQMLKHLVMLLERVHGNLVKSFDEMRYRHGGVHNKFATIRELLDSVMSALSVYSFEFGINQCVALELTSILGMHQQPVNDLGKVVEYIKEIIEHLGGKGEVSE